MVSGLEGYREVPKHRETHTHETVCKHTVLTYAVWITDALRYQKRGKGSVS